MSARHSSSELTPHSRSPLLLCSRMPCGGGTRAGGGKANERWARPGTSSHHLRSQWPYVRTAHQGPLSCRSVACPAAIQPTTNEHPASLRLFIHSAAQITSKVHERRTYAPLATALLSHLSSATATPRRMAAITSKQFGHWAWQMATITSSTWIPRPPASWLQRCCCPLHAEHHAVLPKTLLRAKQHSPSAPRTFSRARRGQWT